MHTSFFSATVLLFLILDPFGNTPIVAALLRGVKPERRRIVILRECGIAYLILMSFLLFGGQLMRFLQLSQTSLGIAGGVVLFIIALRMIFPPPEGGVFGEVGTDEPFVVPLAIPAIAGPSALASVMLFASREPNRWLEWAGAVTLAMALATFVLLLGNRLIRRLGTRGMTALERLMGLILSALAVEMLLRGVQAFVVSLRVS